jgi:ectoine hydroxylase-related dioxygenase (phytanoyl-CoA dioxygenase family)
MSDHDISNIHTISNHLKDEGYAIVRNVLTSEKVRFYLTEVTRIYIEEKEAAEKGLRQNDADYQMYHKYGDQIFNLVRKSRVFDELYENSVVMAVLKETMKNKFILTQTEIRRPKINEKVGSANLFHRDGRIVVDADLWISAFWVLEDVTETNGPTTIIPRSHKQPLDPKENSDKAINLLANAGDLIFINANTLHMANKPLDNASRWILIFTYNQWYLKPTVDHTQLFSRSQVEAMTPVLRELFGYTSIPPSDERKCMYTCRPWNEVSDEFVFGA